MTIRETPWPEGTPCWVDLAVDDFGQAQEFYGEVFGWDVPVGLPEFGGYATATKDGHPVAGLAPKMRPDQPTAWTVYLASDDVDATVRTIRENHGKVHADPMDVSDMGRMALAVDPGGAFFGLWQSGKHTGFQLASEPGSVAWHENYSRDWEANKDFYAAVFGWQYDDMSEGGVEYAAFKVGDRPAGGIGRLGDDLPLEMSAYWNVYFTVEDTDATIAAMRRLGGLVVRDAWDTPYGRMAEVADNQGAPFLLMGAEQA